MENDKRSSQEKVRALFDSRAVESPDLNAVLDASSSSGVRFQNLFRDFLTKRMMVRCLRPRKHESLLDFGCGVGRLSEYLAPRFRSITGVDISEEMLRVARNTGKAPNVEYHSVSTLSTLADGTFDKSMSFWVLQHITEERSLGSCIDTLHRLIKPEGLAFIFEQVRTQPESLGDILTHRVPDEYIKEFSRRGFRLESTRRVFRYPSYGMDVWRWLGVENWLTLRIAERVEILTASRKPAEAEYWTQMFMFKRCD